MNIIRQWYDYHFNAFLKCKQERPAIAADTPRLAMLFVYDFASG